MSINQGNNTVTLDEAKTVDLAKIVKNEARLKQENSQLLETIRKQDSTINSLADKNIYQLQRIVQQNKTIEEMSRDIHNLAVKQLEYEEKKKASARLFLKAGLDNIPGLETTMPHGGLTYLFKKWGLGARVGVIDKEFFYGGEIAISLF